MGTRSWWALAALATAALPGCISVPNVGSIWMSSGEPACATLRAQTHAQPLVFATLIDSALPAWRSRLDSSDAPLVRVGVATVRGLDANASEAVTTVLRIDRRAADGSLVRTYAYAHGEAGDDGAPPAEGFQVVRLPGEGLAIDGVARRGTERAILVGSQADEGGAHGVIVFSPGSPDLIVRETNCRATREEPPSAVDGPPPVVAPGDEPSTSPAPVQVPAREDPPSDGPVQVPMQVPSDAPVLVPSPSP